MARLSVVRPSFDDKKSVTTAFAGDKIQHNVLWADYVRTWLAIVSGCAAGVLGYTGLWGLAVYFLTHPDP
ncbi:hypothetical protein T484DRAFT_2210169 [Baffinella frigidus]|nr:hypothetical protein T484DRAFT_2210169 [Cryptophyta sp. CCMP2293]